MKSKPYAHLISNRAHVFYQHRSMPGCITSPRTTYVYHYVRIDRSTPNALRLFNGQPTFYQHRSMSGKIKSQGIPMSTTMRESPRCTPIVLWLVDFSLSLACEHTKKHYILMTTCIYHHVRPHSSASASSALENSKIHYILRTTYFYHHVRTIHSLFLGTSI